MKIQKEAQTINIRELCEEYYSMVLGYLMRLTGGDRCLAEDLTQETFIRAIKASGKFKENSKVSTWLCQIAKYTFYQYLQKKKHRKEISYDSLGEIPTSVWPELRLIQKEGTQETLKIIEELEPKMREVVYLRVYGELDFHEIAKIMDQTENWARVNFFRAKQQLKKKLGNRTEDFGKEMR